MSITPALQRLISHWQAMPRRAGSRLPPRAAFDAEKALNEHHRLSIIKRVGPYDIYAELVRLDVAQNWERPIAGISVFDLAAPTMRENIAKFHAAILEKPCGALIAQNEAGRMHGQASLTSLYLPFSDRDGKETVILGFTQSTGPGLKASLKTQLVISFDQVEALTFVDLGHGVPQIEFESAPTADTGTISRRGWWERFLPQQRQPVSGEGDRGPKESSASQPPHAGFDHLRH